MLFLLCIVLLVLTFVKKHALVGLFCGIFFILLGVLSWNGIGYVDSTIVTVSGSTYNISDHYSPMRNTLSTKFTDNVLIGFSFSLFGLFLLIVSSILMMVGKSQIPLDDETNNEFT